MYFVLAIALILGIAAMGTQWWTMANGGADENGYLVTGRLLTEQGTIALVPRVGPDAVAPTYVSDMWVGKDLGTPQAHYYVKYPPGFPSLVALTLLCTPASEQLRAVYLLNPIGYGVGLLGVFFFARRLAGSLPAIAAMCTVAFSGVVIRMFSIPGSHGISFGLLCWAAYLLLRWMQTGGYGSAIGAGLLCGAAAAVRSGEAVLLLPLVMAAVLRPLAQKRRADVLQAVAMLAGWLLVVAVAVGAQYALTGTWTGYSATGEHSGFALRYLAEHWWLAMRAVSWRGIGLLAPLGVIGLAVIWRHDWRTAIVLATWVVANVLLYASYYWSSESQLIAYGRFYLPSYAILAGAAMAAVVLPLVRGDGRRVRHGAVPVSFAIAMISVFITVFDCSTFAQLETFRRFGLADRLNWVQERVPSDAVLLCDETDMLNDLQFTSNLWLYDHRLFDLNSLRDLAEADGLDALDPIRRKWLEEQFVRLGQAGLTQMRDRMIAAHIQAGRRVFVFCGPANHWRGWDSLAPLGLRATFAAAQEPILPRVPTVPNVWHLLEIVPARAATP